MKKLLMMLGLCLIFVFCAIGFAACEDDEVNSGTPTEQSNDITNVNGGGNNSNGNNSGNNVNNNPQPTADEYFTFTLLDDDTYEISAKEVNNMPASVVIPSTYNGKAVTSIGDDAFEYCSSLTSVTIGNSVASIGKRAFYVCYRLTSITIPDSVTSIGPSAFEDCRNLTTVYYKGTAEEWSKISISVWSNDYLINATRYYYSKSAPTGEGNYWHYDTDGVTPVVWAKEN